ncbi:MAG TPA: ABC transporter ATP-binding protein [Cyclobacteriaceae bacterium]|jgi:ABC-type multidrug transport system ATPase subunit|nr:ABC transporter ATP-binding protein [Cyclobacteriaceae bacterium]
MESAVKVERVYKNFQSGKTEIEALNNISFEVERGELFGLIGPDGAGKTTLFRILTTLMIANKGNAWVDGFEVVSQYKEIRKRVGYMPGRFSLYQDLSVEENISFFATLFGTTLEENYEFVKDIYVQIEPFKKRRAGALSGGMKQKLALSCALIHRPSVLFLDEPTTGVDAVSRQEFWDLLKSLQHQGITIVVSTPYMDEANLCDRVALMQNGKIMDIDTPKGITQKFPKPLWAIIAADMYKLMHDLRSDERVDTCYPFGQYHHITFTEMNQEIQSIEKTLVEKGHADLSIQKIEPTIEDCFMELMNK